jgi:ribose transport system ATP-binding protein
VGLDTLAPALEARRISKSFGGTRALDAAGIELRRGEVHGLLGQNGSGKSTLIRILAGFHTPDPGAELTVGGRPVPLPLPPGRAPELGLRFVHQDLGLIPSLSALENLLLDELATARWRHLSWRRERDRARRSLARLGVDIDPRATVASLTPLERAQLAILRAVEATPDVLVLDEPTAFLPGSEREQLYELMRGIAAGGRSVLLVSHDLGEVREVADRVTVLRDGSVVRTAEAASIGPEELVELVVGRRLEPLDGRFGAPRRAPAPVQRQAIPEAVRIVGLRGDVVRDVSIELCAGETVGLAGLVGSGFDEVPYLLFGVGARRAGRLTLGGGELDLAAMTPQRALYAGMALLPAERARDGAVGSLAIEANVTLPVLDRYAGARGLDRRRLLRDAAAMLEENRITPCEPRAAFETLSGGNQQRTLLAKWLQTDAPLLLLDEPTRGVDVGARQEIAAAIRALAERGMVILCASTDHELLASICGRVLIFSGGDVVLELAGEEVTKERITERCSLSG